MIAIMAHDQTKTVRETLAWNLIYPSWSMTLGLILSDFNSQIYSKLLSRKVWGGRSKRKYYLVTLARVTGGLRRFSGESYF